MPRKWRAGSRIDDQAGRLAECSRESLWPRSAVQGGVFVSRATRAQAPDIDIKHVYYFLMLAKHGSISKAANALGLAQPSLSEHVARLEARLNTKLAIRGPRGVTLTEAGRFLAREGHKLVDVARALTDSLREMSDELQGTVSIGLPPSLSLLVSIPLAETMRLEAPGIRLHLTEGLSGHILDWIEQEQLDMGFVYTMPPSTGFQTDAILEEEIFVVAAEDNVPVEPDEDGGYSIPASQLGELPLVMPGLPHSARHAIERFARAHGLNLNVIVEIDSLSQIIEMVSRASAFSILPHAPVAKLVEEGKLVLIRIKDPGFNRTVYLTRKRSRAVSMVSLTVEKTVLKIIEEMVERYGLRARFIANEKPGRK
ncbi:LysR family transcriptional regulator (plasmid) [Paracoccus versutus]|nr:LysR family transcriptional regulator [Paracoccus versutus]WEJ82287.1 LysR family transcriptional regulator [Paracoccus versutus]WGR56057.1 LysR family transcriptional regulator [Paracoccus versutus]